MGGYLAEPTSATENDELTKLINDKDSGSVWIGVDDIAEEALTIGNGYDLWLNGRPSVIQNFS